jgi:dipeptidyl aminopeptidase/acylaminoacyl peptidase
MRVARRVFLRFLAATGGSISLTPELGKGWTEERRRRPFTWADAANRWNIESMCVSTDGEAFALQVTRPLNAHGIFVGQSLEWVDARGDLWLLDSELGAPRRLDGAPGGAWSPCFAPDGKRLSALTLVGPGRVGLVVWSLNNGGYRTFSGCNVEVSLSRFRSATSAYAGPSGFFAAPRQYLWLDARSILFVDHGAGLQQGVLAISSLTSTLQGVRQRTERGQLSVRVWSDRSPTCGEGGRLCRISCDTGEIETLYEGDVRGVSVSPDGRWLAVVAATGNVSPVPQRPMEWPLRSVQGSVNPMVQWKLVLVDLSSVGGISRVLGVTGVGDITPSRLPIWSVESSRIVIPVRTTYSDDPATGNDCVWEVSVKTGHAHRWSASSALDAELLAALLTTDGLNTKQVIENRPQQIRAADYTAGGQISGGAWRCPGEQVMFWNAPTVMLIAPAGKVAIPGAFSVVQPPTVGDGTARALAIRADGRSCVITAWSDKYSVEDFSTEPGWALLSVRPKDSAAVYKKDSDNGTFLVLARPGRRPRSSVLRFNTYFRDVLRPSRRMLTWSFPDGSVRTGALVLPVDHRRGQRHPVIVWAYPDGSPSLHDYFTELNSYNSVIRPIQYLLTQGFAFLEAPFPIGEFSGKSNKAPLLAAVNAVLPWLDVLEREPEILPGEYGFFGHSNAGYVALALEGLTCRFKAIVAWDTFPEIGFDVLHSSTYDVAWNCAGNVLQSERMLYEDPRQPYVPRPVPPWTNPGKYIKNEPLFHLNQASSPLLLVQGEFDADPNETEEVYSILYGRGVPVELAYYWGEGHVFASPGNIRDSWLRTKAFFKRYLRSH